MYQIPHNINYNEEIRKHYIWKTTRTKKKVRGGCGCEYDDFPTTPTFWHLFVLVVLLLLSSQTGRQSIEIVDSSHVLQPTRHGRTHCVDRVGIRRVEPTMVRWKSFSVVVDTRWYMLMLMYMLTLPTPPVLIRNHVVFFCIVECHHNERLRWTGTGNAKPWRIALSKQELRYVVIWKAAVPVTIGRTVRVGGGGGGLGCVFILFLMMI